MFDVLIKVPIFLSLYYFLDSAVEWAISVQDSIKL